MLQGEGILRQHWDINLISAERAIKKTNQIVREFIMKFYRMAINVWANDQGNPPGEIKLQFLWIDPLEDPRIDFNIFWNDR